MERFIDAQVILTSGGVTNVSPQKIYPFPEIDTFDTLHVNDVGKGPHFRFPFLTLGFLTRAMLLRCLMI